MTRLKTSLILLSSALIASSFALAQDPGTYRPGSPYSAAQATDAAVCSAQCSGDAACRGWNFVRSNPRQKSGICEFNSLAVDPIQSPVSVSANISSVSNITGQNHIISTGVRTTRIGSPSPARPRITQASTPTKTVSPARQAQTQPRQIQAQQIQAQQPQKGLSIAEQLSPCLLYTSPSPRDRG